MLNLAAFADEISPNLDDQIDVCRECGITHFELRGVNNVNVLDFDKPLRAQVKRKLDAAGRKVACIGSPIGKVKVTDPWQPHFERFKVAVELAEFFGAPFVRVFSYYPPDKGGDVRPHRDEVLRRMRAKVDFVRDRRVVLLHENEKGIYGDKGTPCLDLMRSIDSPKLRTAFDFGNFVNVGESPLDNWPGLKPYTTHFHIKDVNRAADQCVPAGAGDGQLGPILADAYTSGYRGFLSLEPHLDRNEQFFGFSGTQLFRSAVDALKKLCAEVGVPLATG